MSVHFSSARTDWATPDAFYEKLHRIYAFDLDVAATAENARCARFFTAKENGLLEAWQGARVWCNPPYGRAIKDWIDKANRERKEATLIVMLVPARTDTKWWHEAAKHARIVLLQGRLKFKGAASSAPFPSALFFWNC